MNGLDQIEPNQLQFMSSSILQSLRVLNTYLSRSINAPAYYYPRNISKMAQQGQEEWQHNPPYRFDKSVKGIWKGKCHCGQIRYELTRRKPLAVKFCHCTGCQVLHGEFLSLDIPSLQREWIYSCFAQEHHSNGQRYSTKKTCI